MKYFLYFFLSFLFINSIRATELELTLPIYRLQIDSVHLAQLNKSPWSDEYFPGKFYFDSICYDCGMRFRGGSARNLPKKSWAIKFDNNENIFYSERINLNAEYLDRSLMRNHLAMKLFQFFNHPAPSTRYASLFVNNVYQGVFLQIEEINEDFLDRNNRPLNTLYEAAIHGASMAPLTHFDDYFTNWEKKIGMAYDYSDIQMLFSKLYYFEKSEFSRYIEHEIDINNFLTGFAVDFTIAGWDCFTKNLFFYFNPTKNQWEIFPWDNDATFGNDIRGNYHATEAKSYKKSPLDNQMLFQRLMEFDYWQDQFWEMVGQVIYDGFNYLYLEIDSTYNQIKNDVYQDLQKRATNNGFDSAVQQLKSFLTERRTFLDGFRYFERISLSDFYCSNPFPSTTDPEVLFRVKSEAPQPIAVLYIKKFPWDTWAGHYTVDSLQLFDDGNHDDLKANDLVYGNSLIFAANDSGLIPFCFRGSGFDYLANGLFYIECYRTHTLALNVNRNVNNFNQHLRFGRVLKNENNLLVEVINSGSVNIDLSYCHFQSGENYHNFLLPEYVSLAGRDTLILTNNKALANRYFDHVKTFGNFFFEIKIGDTLRLLSPTLTDLITTVCDSFSLLPFNPISIVINEINYHAADSLDCDDWVEFYNPNGFEADISDWSFKDQDDNHIFIFPQNTVMNPKGFLVLCRSLARFNQVFPDVSDLVGELDFGLNGTGELIRFYDVAGHIIDSIRYSDDPPWPAEPDGRGATLELINPLLDNSLAENWAASTNHGTPGKKNSVFTGIAKKNQLQPVQFRLYQNYPNPFNQKTIIQFDIAKAENARLKIYNLTGQLVKVIIPHNGECSIICDMTGFSSGIYFYQLEMAGKKLDVKKAVLLK